MTEISLDSSVQAALSAVQDREWLPLLRQTECPEEVQQTVLRGILTRQASTRFGTEHGFRTIRTYREFCHAVPVLSYEDLRPYVEAQETMRVPYLNAEQPASYVQTSGTTGQPKHVPILARTVEWIRQYQRLFAYAQWRAVPPLYRGGLLVLAGQAVEGHLPGGSPFGSMSGLMNECLPAAIRRQSVLADGVGTIADYRQKYLCIAACALADPSLSVLATPNPSTILKLVEVIRLEFDLLIEALSAGARHPLLAPISSDMSGPATSPDRLARLRSLRGQAATVDLAKLWPDLQAVITWTGGNCAVLIPKLRALLPSHTAIMEMGYLSSECLGSLNIDVRSNQCIPTFQEYFFEFIEVAEGETRGSAPVPLEALSAGHKYEVLVTASNGLYRYAMNDIVEVTGYVRRTPTIRFVQKGKGVTNITGEKLYEYQVIEAVDGVMRSAGCRGGFYLMVANVDEARYTLYLEQIPAIDRLGEEIDRRLGEVNVEYKAKRQSGRLAALEVVSLRPGAADAYRDHCVARGQREAQFKLVRLQYAHDCSFEFARHAR